MKIVRSGHLKTMVALFPGQGTQYVAMGKDLYETYVEAKDIFDKANERLQEVNLIECVFEGPEERLRKTEYSQPAILCHSLAIWSILQNRMNLNVADQCSFVMGHSLGEYTALVVAGYLKFEDAVWLVHQRGKLIQEVVDHCAYSTMMAAILHPDGICSTEVRNSIETSRLSSMKDSTNPFCCDIAAINSKQQWVLSGFSHSVIQVLEKLQQQRTIKRSKLLNVNAPFHSAILKPVLLKFAECLEKVNFHSVSSSERKPHVISNVTGQDISGIQIDDLKKLLLDHLVHTVKWHDSMIYALDQTPHLNHVIELGPGRTLTNLISSIHVQPHIKTWSLQSLKDLNYVQNLI